MTAINTAGSSIFCFLISLFYSVQRTAVFTGQNVVEWYQLRTTVVFENNKSFQTQIMSSLDK
jgi:hypothetical protein